MKRELDAGLALLADRYGFEIRPFDGGVTGGSDYSSGPSSHDISWKSRVLWLQAGQDEHFEWLHEVAHLVVSPPWEDGPARSSEFSGIFGWERAVGRELVRLGRWTRSDWSALLKGQDVYGLGTVLAEWGLGSQYAEWGSMRVGHQRICMSYMYATLRAASLLDASNRPTWTAPTWTDEVLDRWSVTREWKWTTMLQSLRESRMT